MPSPFRTKPVTARVWSVGRFLLLIGALGFTFGAFFLAGMRVATRARDVEVPDLAGRSVPQATELLADRGLVLRVDEARRPDKKVPVDHVLTQDPEPGSVIRQQRAVRVRLSDGQRAPVVPSVLDLPERTAEITLQGEQIAISSRAEIRSPDHRPGVVVAQSPRAGLRAAEVSLLVNRGESAVTYVMPDLIGTLGIRAADVLRSQGFRVATTAEVPYPGVPPGIIVRQTPQAGFQLTSGETISLEVSR